jgi:outer membrane biosynthesis protein TonB
MTISRKTLSLPGLALVAALLAPAAAQAQEQAAALQECAKQWIAAKENPKFYQPWPEYFTECKKRLDAESAAKAAAEPPPAPQPEAKKEEPAKLAPTAATSPAPAPAPAPKPAAAPAPAPEPAKPAHKPAKKPAHHKPQN